MNTKHKDYRNELKTILVKNKRTTNSLLMWYNNREDNAKLNINSLFDYDPNIIIGLIKSWLHHNNIIWLLDSEYVLIRYLTDSKNMTFIRPDPDFTEALDIAFEDESEKVNTGMGIKAIPIVKSWTSNDINVIEYIFNSHENPF